MTYIFLSASILLTAIFSSATFLWLMKRQDDYSSWLLGHIVDNRAYLQGRIDALEDEIDTLKKESKSK